MGEGKSRIVREIHKPEEMYGFVIPDLVIGVASFIMAGIFHNLISLIIMPLSIVGILYFRHLRMAKPKGYFNHLLYFWGFLSPPKGIPPGNGVTEHYYE